MVRFSMWWGPPFGGDPGAAAPLCPMVNPALATRMMKESRSKNYEERLNGRVDTTTDKKVTAD